MPHPILIVLSCTVPDPEDVVDVIKAIDPPHVPGFTGEVRVVVGTDVADTIHFLDIGDDDA